MYYLKLIGLIVLFIVIVMFAKLLIFEPTISKFVSKDYVKPVTALLTISLQVTLFIVMSRFLDLELNLKAIDFGKGALLSVTLISIIVIILVSFKLISFERQNSLLRVLLVLIIFSSVTVLFEEIVFRGLLYGGLRQNIGIICTMAISVSLFVIPHLFNSGINIYSVISVFLGGYILCLLYEISDSILTALGFHFIWNLSQSILGFNVSGNEMNGYLKVTYHTQNKLVTGGEFGIESSIITLAVLFVTSVFLTVLLIKKVTLQ